jgi:transposase InsO family protein
LLAVRHFLTRAQARRAVAGWIEEYNQIRRHSTNGMLSPVAFESARARARDEAAA